MPVVPKRQSKMRWPTMKDKYTRVQGTALPAVTAVGFTGTGKGMTDHQMTAVHGALLGW